MANRYIKSGTRGITFQTHTWELPNIEILDGYMTIHGVLNADKGLRVPGVIEALVGEQGAGIVSIEYDTSIRGSLQVGGQLALDSIVTGNPQFLGNVGIGQLWGEVFPASSSLIVFGPRIVNSMIGCHFGHADEACYGMTFNVLNTACNSSIDFKYSTDSLNSGQMDFDYSYNNCFILFRILWKS